MSDNIPIEIQEQILKRLPAKSLIQFRSISKTWKSLIDSSAFIAGYSGRQKHLLVTYRPSVQRRYVSIVDDDTFPQQQVSHPIHSFAKMLKDSCIIGTSHGLICLYGDHREDWGTQVFGTGKVVLWNFSIRKAVAVIVPNVANHFAKIFQTILGFGVCRETTDPKIVKITYISNSGIESVSCIPRQVEIFTLSTGVWRSSYSNNLPRISVEFFSPQVVLDLNGFLYWIAIDRVTTEEGGLRRYNLIISFDITSEEFREIYLPEILAEISTYHLSMCKLKESLVVLQCGLEANYAVSYVWKMQDGLSKSFTKLFTIDVNIPVLLPVYMRELYVRGFRKTGEPLLEKLSGGTGELLVYEPHSKHINNLEIKGKYGSFFVSSYMETLLMLDQPDFATYANGKRCISKLKAKSKRML